MTPSRNSVYQLKQINVVSWADQYNYIKVCTLIHEPMDYHIT